MFIFTCATDKCENQINPINFEIVVNPVLCSLCGIETDAVEQTVKAAK